MTLTGLMLAALVSACGSGVVVTGGVAAGPPRLAGLASASGAGALATRPSPDPPADPRTTDLRAYAHYAAGVELALAGRWKEALARFEQARSLDPASARIELKIAECLDHLGRSNEALTTYQRASALAPNDFKVQAALGVMLERRGRPAEAMQAFDRALAAPDADPDAGRYVLVVWHLASLTARHGDRTKAVAHYTRLLHLLSHPQRDYHHYRQVWALVRHREFVCEELGKLHLLQGDVKAAIRYLETGRALAPNAVTIAYRLADAYLRDGRRDQALRETDRLLQLAGNDAAALDLLIRVTGVIKKPEEAVRRLEPRLKADPDNFLLRFYLGASYRQIDRLVQAEQLLRTVVEAQPTSPTVHAELAATLRQQKRFDAAMDILVQALDREALGPSVLREIDQVTRELKADTPARRAWQERAERQPDSRGAQYLLGHLLASLGQHEQAATTLAGVVRANPTFLWAYVDLAAVHSQRKQYAEALAVYRSALTHGLARNPLIYRMMAHLHERLDQLPAAMQAVDEALRIAPNDRHSQYLKAVLFERMKKDEEAERAFRGILAQDPDDPDANNALSYFLATRKRGLDEARRLIDRALQHEPENGAYLDTLGWVLYQQGSGQEALETLKRAAEAIKNSHPDGDPVILDHLGDAHHRLRHYDEARQAWLQALKLNEKDPNPEIDPRSVQEKIDDLPK